MYIWTVRHNDNDTDYSPYFETVSEAYSWYSRKGISLERMFNRCLKLKKTGEQDE